MAFTFSFLFWQKIITIHCSEKFQFQLSEQQHSWLQKSFFAPINWKYHDRFLLYLKRTIEVLALKKGNIVKTKKFFVRIWKTLGNSWTRIFTAHNNTACSTYRVPLGFHLVIRRLRQHGVGWIPAAFISLEIPLLLVDPPEHSMCVLFLVQKKSNIPDTFTVIAPRSENWTFYICTNFQTANHCNNPSHLLNFNVKNIFSQNFALKIETKNSVLFWKNIW